MATETSAYERLTGGNRKQRKDLQRRLYSGDPGLDVVHANAAGIDIGNESHFVAVPPGRDAEPVREFGSWTADLERMAVWLKSCGIETVAMQSTGVYWFAVYDVLEKHGLKVFLVNASHTKNLPGRKSDVQESQLRDRRIKASEEEVARSLEGNWQEDQLFELKQAVDEYDFRQKQISECDRGLQAYLAVLPSRPVPAADTGNVVPPPIAPGKRKKRAKKTGGGNAPPSFDLAAELKRVTGVDAIRIEGVNLMTIQTVVAELGTELGKWWPTEQHFASWLNLSPKRDVSGGKVIRHTHEKNRNRVAGICGWLPSRYSAATVTWVRATGIFAQGWAPPKRSRRPPASWPVSFTTCSNTKRNTSRSTASSMRNNFGVPA